MTNEEREKHLDWLYRLKREIFVFMPIDWLIPFADALDVAIKALEQEPTTKNDLGVDAVSRKAVHDMLENLPITVEDKWFNWLQKACMRLAELPSVTPQEPRKGEWLRMSDLSEQEDDRYKCSRCGNVIHHKSKMYLYTFNSWCGRCGSDNGRHINYEVEE